MIDRIIYNLEPILVRMPFARDKSLHLIFGAVIFIFCFSVIGIMFSLSLLNVTLMSFGITLIIGIAKEVYDSFGHGTPEIMDVVATIAVGFIISLIIISVLITISTFFP